MREPEDVELDSGEAEAQREETIMPWIWGAFGVVLIAAFVAWVLITAPSDHVIRHPPGVAPVLRPAGHTY